MTPAQRRAAGNLLHGACGQDRASAELGARAAVDLAEGLGLDAEATLELAERLTGVAAIAAAALKTLAPPRVVAWVVDGATDLLAAVDEKAGGS